MARLGQKRTDDEGKPRTIVWDGTRERAVEIVDWARNSSYNARFALSIGASFDRPGDARTLVEQPDEVDGQGNVIFRGTSSEWVPTPIGSTIERLGRDPDAPLRVHPPIDPIAVLEAA